MRENWRSSSSRRGASSPARNRWVICVRYSLQSGCVVMVCSLVSGGGAVAAWIGSPSSRPLMADNGPGVAHRLAEIGQHFHLVLPSSRRRAMQAGAKRPSSFSDSEDCPQCGPAASVAVRCSPAAAPLQDIAGKQRRLGSVADRRRPSSHRPSPGHRSERGGRVEGVEWLFARASAGEMLRIEAEGRPAVLPDDPGVRDHHAAAELVIDTLNKRHCQSAVIHDAHPDGIARAFTAAPGVSAGVVDAVGQRLQGFRVSNCCTSTSRWRGSVICASRRANARLVASTIRCTVCASSASAIFRRSVMPRIASDTSPCVGGARFHSVPAGAGASAAPDAGRGGPAGRRV